MYYTLDHFDLPTVSNHYFEHNYAIDTTHNFEGVVDRCVWQKVQWYY